MAIAGYFVLHLIQGPVSESRRTGGTESEREGEREREEEEEGEREQKQCKKTGCERERERASSRTHKVDRFDGGLVLVVLVHTRIERHTLYFLREESALTGATVSSNMYDMQVTLHITVAPVHGQKYKWFIPLFLLQL